MLPSFPPEQRPAASCPACRRCRPMHEAPLGARTGIAGLQPHLLLANFNEHLATLYQIKPFLLLVVQMARWAAPCHVGVLQKEESAVRILGADFEIKMAVRPRPLMVLAKPVRS